jgi:uncharacterized protein
VSGAPKTFRVSFERNVAVPLRDGTILRADLYLPDAAGPFPALLQRTPYNKSYLPVILSLDPLRAAGEGYAVVVQDTRGRYASEGNFYPFQTEADDGYDSVEWVAAQPWCNGKVGMLGASYVGANQLHAAQVRPPHLAAIAPWITGSDYHEGWTYQGGAFCLGFNLNWTLARLAPDLLARCDALHRSHRLEKLRGAVDRLTETYRRLPLADQPELAGCAPFYFDWLAHPDDDAYWQPLRIEAQYEQIGVPAFHLGAWYDSFLGGTLRNFVGLRDRAGSELARRQQKLIVGPWTHSTDLSNLVGEVDFGQSANRLAFDLDGMLLRWFNRWLMDANNGVDAEPAVRLFVMGENVWRDEWEWPLARAIPTPFYLHSRGRANSLDGDGALSQERPGAEAPDVYTSDPFHPVPTRGGGLCCYPPALPPGAYDQRPIEARADVLVYTSDPLDADLEVTGPVTSVLSAATTAPDVDFTAKLVDVSPCGYARNLADGIVRGRYREDRRQSRLLQPGRVAEYVVDLTATSNVFRVGHRLRLEVASNNFPRFDRNPQTGAPAAEATALAPAIQTVYHDRSYPSRLILPIVPRTP